MCYYAKSPAAAMPPTVTKSADFVKSSQPGVAAGLANFSRPATAFSGAVCGTTGDNLLDTDLL